MIDGGRSESVECSAATDCDCGCCRYQKTEITQIPIAERVSAMHPLCGHCDCATRYRIGSNRIESNRIGAAVEPAVDRRCCNTAALAGVDHLSAGLVACIISLARRSRVVERVILRRSESPVAVGRSARLDTVAGCLSGIRGW